MAGKTYVQKIQFQSSFDGAEVLSGLKKIRQSMSNAGADASLFKGVDKDIAQAEKLVTDLLAQIQKGFSNPKEIANFEKQFEKLGSSLSKINVGLQGVNEVGNFNLNAAEIQKYTKELDKLTAKQGQLEQAAKDSIAAQLDAAKLTQKERQAIMDEVEAQGDLEAAIKKVAQAKEKAAKAKHGTKAMEEGSGREYIDTKVDVGLTADDVGATAKKGNVKRGKNDARARDAAGNLIKSDGKNQIDELKTNIALQESYKKALEEVVRTGGTADDAVELMKKSMGEYGIELTETTQLLYNFQHEIEDFYTDNLSSQQHAAITRAQSLGRTNIDGQFELSQQGQEIVDNADMQAAQQNLGAIRQAQEQVNAEIQEGERATEQFVQEQTQGLEQAQQAQEDLERSAKESTEKMKEQAEATTAMNNKFDDMKQAVKTFLSIGSAIGAVRNIISQTFNDIKELDKSFANIAMVTSYTVGQMWNSYEQYAQMANELGQSTQSVIEASGLFYQQGLDTAESLALTEDTMKLATLAGTDFAEATSQMTAALRGFKMEMDEGARVTDVYSELAAKAAADVQGIAYAMSKTASIAESAGMEFETTSAFLTQMIETTQEAPENIGTAMKTIIARFTELKTNVAGTADSEFEDLDYNKVDTALKSVGVSIKDASGQFRDLDDVFLELSGKWNTLDRNTQRYIATIAAGSRQQSRFIAMMDNYERTIELVNTAYNSAGKSSEQFNKYQDTIEYKLNKLKNSWEQLRVSFFNSKGYGDAIVLLTKLLDKVREFELVDFAALGAVWLTLGKIVIQNFIRGIQSSTNGIIKVFSATFDKVKNSVMNKIGMRIPLDLSPQMAEARINALRQKLQSLEAEKIELDANPTPALRDLALIQQRLDELQLDATQIKFTPSGKAYYEDAQGKRQSFQVNGQRVTKNQFNAAQNAGQQRANLNNEADSTAALLGDAEKNKQMAQVRGQAIGQSFAVAFTAATTSVVMRENPGQVFGDVVVSGLTAMIPTVISVATTMGASMAAATAGISILVTVLIAGAAALVKWTQNTIEQKQAQAENANVLFRTRKNIKVLTEAQEKLNETLSETNAELNKQKDQYELLTKNEKKLKEYHEALILTVDEQEDYISTSNEIAESFPQLIDYYDEQGNAILKMGEAWEEAKNQQREYYAEAKTEQSKAQLAVESNKMSLLEQRQLEMSESAKTVKDFEKQINVISGMDRLEAFYLDVASEWNGEEYKTATSLENYGRTLINGIISMGAIPGITVADTALGNESLMSVMTGYKDNLKGDPDQINDSINMANVIRKAMIDQGFTEFNELSDEEVFQKWIDTINDNPELAKKYQEALKRGTDALIEQGDLSSELNDEISKQKDAMDDALSDIAASSLAMSENYTDASLNVQELMKESLKNNSNIDWSDLEQDWENSVEYKMYYNSNGDPISTDEGAEERAQAAKNEWIYKNAISEEEAQAVLDLYDEETQKYIDQQYYAKLTNLTIKERVKLIQELEVEDEIKEDLLSVEDENIEAYNKSIEEMATLFGASTTLSDGLLTILDPNLQYIEQFSEDFRKNFSNTIKDLSQEERIIFQSQFGNLLSGLSLTEEEASALFGIDWSTVNFSNEKEMKDKIAQSYEEATGEAIDEERLSYLFENMQEFSEKHGIIDLTLQIPEAQYDKLKEDLNSLSGIGDTITSAISESLEQGFVGSDTLASLQEAFGEDLEKYLTIDKDTMLATLNIEAMDEAFYEELASIQLANDEIYQEKMARIEVLETIRNQVDALGEVASAQNVINALIRDSSLDIEKAKAQFGQDIFNLNVEEIDQMIEAERESAAEYVKQHALYNTLVATAATEYESAATEAMNNAQGATEDATEALKEYEETLHGTAEWLDEQDPFIALTESISVLEKELEKLQKQLENVQDPSSASELINAISQNRITQLENLTAQQRAAESQLTQLRDFYLNSEYQKYYTELPNGTIRFDMAEWAETGGSDEMGDWLMEMAAMGNEARLMLLETESQMQEIYDEQEEERIERLENYISLQETIADTLRENAEEEVNIQKEKYDALKEADDDYLSALEDAINKQRELREQENAYEDLAQKEKKLALLQRDTSGANEKETKKLEEEIQDDRQQLLDDKVDDIIENLKSTYELQAEVRDLEIEQKEIALEEKNYISEAANILRNMTGGSDIIAWMIENNKDWDTYTTEQQEKFISEWEKLGNDWATYLAQEETEYNDFLSLSETNIQAYLNNTASAITDSIDRIKKNEEAAQAEREKKAQETIDNINNISDTALKASQKIKKAMQGLNDEENVEKINYNSLTKSTLTGTARDEAYKSMYNAAKGKTNLSEFLKNYSSNQDLASQAWQAARKEEANSYSHGILWPDGTISPHETAQVAIDSIEEILKSTPQNGRDGQLKMWANTDNYQVFKKGGFVDYTGPAWVDGTPNKPEAFLSAEDTARIGAAAKLLADLPIFNTTSNAENAVSTNIGDTSIEIHINVENISDDYDVDQMIERVKQDIVDVAKPIGTSVILNK